METIVIIHPTELHSELHSLLVQKIRQRMVQGECTRDHGYLIEVRDLDRILDNKVSYDGTVLVRCVFDVTYFKPEVGMEMKENVIDIFEQGIFCNIKNRIRTLIPRVSLVGYTYTKDGYTAPGGLVIRQGTQIQIRIMQTRYLNGNYSCIAHLIC